jgi:hypothetical protein
MLSSGRKIVRNPGPSVVFAPLNYFGVLNNIWAILELQDFFEMKYVKIEEPKGYSYVRAKVIIKQETNFVLQV